VSDDTKLGVVVFILCVTVLFFAFIMGGEFGFDRGYKRGQIDVLSKKCIQYELTINEDSSKTWKMIKK